VNRLTRVVPCGTKVGSLIFDVDGR
jgi:hypothetical protein